MAMSSLDVSIATGATDGGWRPAGGRTTPVVRSIPGLFSAERAGSHATAGL